MTMSALAQGIAKRKASFKGIVSSRHLSIQFLDEDWKPLENKDYEYIMSDGRKIEDKKTDGKGLVSEPDLQPGGKIRLKLSEKPETGEEEEMDSEEFSEVIGYPETPGPLPVLDLRNRSEGGQGPLQRGDPRRSLVEHLQRMLYELGYDLGTSGREEDGVDGSFQDKTEAAVKEFQRSNKDWDGKQLREDGIVGPRTSDALNRELVGIWYDNYETPSKLTPGCKIATVTEDFIAEQGLSA